MQRMRRRTGRNRQKIREGRGGRKNRIKVNKTLNNNRKKWKAKGRAKTRVEYGEGRSV